MIRPRKVLAVSVVLAVTVAVILGGLETGRQALGQIEPEAVVVKPFQSKIKLGDSVLRLVAHGVIEPQKLKAIYEWQWWIAR